jgi:hypothetical protein
MLMQMSCFKEQWSVEYFVVENKGKAVCLICNETIAVLKEYNICRHYDTKHPAKYSGLIGLSLFYSLVINLETACSDAKSREI